MTELAIGRSHRSRVARGVLITFVGLVAAAATGFGCWQMSNALNHEIDQWVFSSPQVKQEYRYHFFTALRMRVQSRILALERLSQDEELLEKDRTAAAREKEVRKERWEQTEGDYHRYWKERAESLPALMWQEFGLGLVSFLLGIGLGVWVLRTQRPLSALRLSILIGLIGAISLLCVWRTVVNYEPPVRVTNERSNQFRVANGGDTSGDIIPLRRNLASMHRYPGFDTSEALLCALCLLIGMVLGCYGNHSGTTRTWKRWSVSAFACTIIGTAVYAFLVRLPLWPSADIDPDAAIYTRRSGTGPFVMVAAGMLLGIHPWLTRPKPEAGGVA